MDWFQGLQEFLTGQAIQVSPLAFFINLLLSAKKTSFRNLYTFQVILFLFDNILIYFGYF